ncbi:hypothetical protein SAMN02745249_00449 [Atopostipes suicloacalis DSM 15692]|uniref:YolD-like protein n=1 Tax=Atopostipes suicloacalis DSM 15692 TaxID=1121025 RepID=A0A1M4TJ06_9LACT|nr:hypothetical protein [Atopostipes suicloacalis]SHE44398.1 hypothetical protein SAMN02745249_00449 [Atopostipes suicloacalis DSM 15692]
MEKKIIRLTPDQLGYKDRGKMKWLGLMLSDHTEALSKMTKEERLKEIEAKPQQSLVEISELLSQAYHTGHPVLIQANILQNGTYFKDVPCMVSGTFEERIYLLLKDGRLVNTILDDIRHVELMNPMDWQKKSE